MKNRIEYRASLAILDQGVREWNRWRMVNKSLSPDLSFTDLSNRGLAGINFKNVNLEGANLEGAILLHGRLNNSNLSKSNFTNATLDSADLSFTNCNSAIFTNSILAFSKMHSANFSNTVLEFANMRRANLSDSVFTNATLEGCDLTGANLIGASIKEANLTHASLIRTLCRDSNFSYARMGGTYFGKTDLTNVVGLEFCEHTSENFLDFQTLLLSENIPEQFLLNCGLNSWQIEAAKLNNPFLSHEDITTIVYKIHELRVQNPIQFYSCFISFSENDKVFARKLYTSLRENGINCWYAPEHLSGGKKIYDQVVNAINQQEKFILILSENSIKSRWVAVEIQEVMRLQHKLGTQILFPITLIPYEKLKDWELFDGDTRTDLAKEVRAYFIPDFSDPNKFEDSIQGLVNDLRSEKSLKKYYKYEFHSKNSELVIKERPHEF